jgi:hypothetical protein
MGQLEAVVGYIASLEHMNRVKAELEDRDETLWIAQLPYVQIRDYQGSIARRDEELARIRREVFSRKPKTDPLADLDFLAWSHSALEILQDLANRSEAGGLYGEELVENYLGDILQYFQACLLTEIKQVRKSVTTTA